MSSGKIIRYIQQSLYEGKAPDKEGYYKFSRKELYEGARISAAAFDKNRNEVEAYFARWCDLKKQGNYPQYAKEMLYIDVKYEKGYFMFKRNPITLMPELQHLWALPPLESYFCYDCYDEQHRRRTNGEPKFDAFPWSWSEAQIQAELIKRKETDQQPDFPLSHEQSKGTQIKKSDHAKRIESIQRNGGRHLQAFKIENITYEMCIVAVEMDGTAIHFVPDHLKTEEIYKIACKSYGVILGKVPKEYVSKEMCESAVSSDIRALDDVPDEYKTHDFFLTVARKNPVVMQKMPEEYLSADFCIDVIKNYGNKAISSLPKTYKNGKFYLPLVEAVPDLIWEIPTSGHTAAVSKAVIRGMGYPSTAVAIQDNPELLSQLHTSLYDHETCLAFVQSTFFMKIVNRKLPECKENSDYVRELLDVQNNVENHCSLKHILRWKDVCEIIVAYLPGCIRYIKEDVLTYEMCLTAIKKCGRFFPDVPKKFRTKELCLIAFEYEPHNIEEFPEEHISYDLYLNAVSRSGYILQKTPARFLTHELCLAAVKSTGHQVKYVPKEILDEEICLAALQNLKHLGFGILGDIPVSLRTYQVCLAAVQADAGSFKFVPEEHKSYELCLAATKQHSFGLSGIPKEFFTEELCLALVERSAVDFKIIPKEKLTERVCLLAISHGDRYVGTILEDVPHELITQDMCNKAVAKSVWSLGAVPEKYVTREMLLYVAGVAPGRLSDNFPEQFRSEAFINEIMQLHPGAANYVKRYL